MEIIGLPPENNTMPQWAGSCWYHLRYIDPRTEQLWIDKRKPIGEVRIFTLGERSMLFFTCYMPGFGTAFYDEGVLANPEPYKKLFTGTDSWGRRRKMSKSVGNVVSDVVIDAYGADSCSFSKCFSPLEAVKPWSEKGIEGCKFLRKVHRECFRSRNICPKRKITKRRSKFCMRLFSK